MTTLHTLQEDRPARLFGQISAWMMVVICVIYIVVLFTGGVVKGVPREPYFAIAEILTILSAVVLVVLMSAVHICAPAGRKFYSMLGLGWMFVMAGITITVHMAELTVVRQLDPQTREAFAWLFDFEWPGLLYGIEFVAWHIGLGLALIFSAFAFEGPGRELWVRYGLLLSGLLCLVGLIGPATGLLQWRLIGVFGYVVVLPVVCIWMAGIFRSTASD